MNRPSIVDALKAELVDLQNELRQKVDDVARLRMKIEGIRTYLDAESSKAPHMFIPRPRALSEPPRQTQGIQGQQHPQPDLAGKGPKAAILAVLSEHPNGLKPSAIARRLEARGFKPSGKTKTQALVAAEVYRMWRAKQIDKNEERRTYRLKQ